jgi:hypothetical protein
MVRHDSALVAVRSGRSITAGKAVTNCPDNVASGGPGRRSFIGLGCDW